MRFVLFLLTLMSAMHVSAEILFQTVSTDIEKNKIVIKLEFDKVVAKDDFRPEYINNTIQVDLANTLLGSNSKSIKVNENSLKKIYLYQPEVNILRARIILNKDRKAKLYRDSVRIKTIDNILIVTVKNPDMSWANVGEEERIKVIPRDIDAELSDAVEKAMTISPILEPKKKLTLGAAEDTKIESAKPLLISKENTEALPAAKKEQLNESEIPVLVKNKEVKAESSSPYFRMIASLFVIGLVAIGSVLFGKKWMRNNKINLDQTKIQVLTQHHLGPRKSLAIIRVAGESILIGVTDQNINMIKTLALIDDEVPDFVPNNFDDAMGFVEDEDYEQAASVVKKQVADAGVEDFTYGNIRKSISKKMKDLRPI